MKRLIKVLISFILVVYSIHIMFYGLLTLNDPNQKSTLSITQDGREVETMSYNVLFGLMHNIGCGERTAASIHEILLEAGISDICDISKTEDDVYTILKITDSIDKVYYVFISVGYFVEEIRAESLEGQQLYYAMQ